MQQTIPYIPDDLQQVINEIYLWIKDGCPRHKYFDTCAGICSNIAWITKWEAVEVNEYFFGENEYPFNSGWFEYNNEQNKYTNLKRLAWLQKHQAVEYPNDPRTSSTTQVSA